MTSTPSIEPGLRIGNYVVEERLGTGTEGLVFLARDVLLGRRVAVKTARVGRESTHGVEEARTLARLEHPHIVRVYHAERSGNSWFIVYEFVAGGTLHAWVERCGPLAPSRALQLATQAAQGLSFAHRQGTLHRDVKPQNLMLSEDGWLKIGDFGLALDLRSQNLGVLPNAGTPAFLAPELWSGAAPSAAADVYSLGACIFFMLKGRPPFATREVEDLRRAHCELSPLLDEEWPAGLRELLFAMLEKVPERRPGSTDELVEWLQLLQRNPERLTSGQAPVPRLPPLVEDGVGLGLQAALQGSTGDPAVTALSAALQQRCRGVVVCASHPGDGQVLVRTAASQSQAVCAQVSLRLDTGKQSLLRLMRTEIAGASASHTLAQLAERLRDQQALGGGVVVVEVVAAAGLLPQQLAEVRELLRCAVRTGLVLVQVLPEESAAELQLAEPDLPRIDVPSVPVLCLERHEQLARFAASATADNFLFSRDGSRVLFYLSATTYLPWVELAIAAIDIAAAAGRTVVASWAVLAAERSCIGDGEEGEHAAPAVSSAPRRWPDERTMELLAHLRREEAQAGAVSEKGAAKREAARFSQGEPVRSNHEASASRTVVRGEVSETSRMSPMTDF